MNRLLVSMGRSLGNMLVRATVSFSDTRKKCQMLQIRLLAGEQKDNTEHLEPYGFTSAPLEGAEAFAAFPDGDRSHGVVLVVADRRYRIRGLEKGEVAIYTDEGDSIMLRRGNKVDVSTKHFVVTATETAEFITPVVKISGRLVAQGEIASKAQVRDKTGSMAAMRVSYHGHTHPGDSGGMTGPAAQRTEYA